MVNPHGRLQCECSPFCALWTYPAWHVLTSSAVLVARSALCEGSCGKLASKTLTIKQASPYVLSAVAALYKTTLGDRLEHTAAETLAYASANMLVETWQVGYTPCPFAVHPMSDPAADLAALLQQGSAPLTAATLASVFASIPDHAQYHSTPCVPRSSSARAYHVSTSRASLYSCSFPAVSILTDSSLSHSDPCLYNVDTVSAIAAA